MPTVLIGPVTGATIGTIGTRLGDLEAASEITDEEFSVMSSTVDAIEAYIGAGDVGVGGAGVRVFSVATYGAVGDGETDDFAAFTAAIAAAGAGNATIALSPAKTYALSKAVIVDGLSQLRITGLGATVTFPSSTTSLGVGTVGYDSSIINPRSAIYLKNCTDVTIEGLIFEGDSVDTNLVTNNTGCAVSCGTSVMRLRLRNCTQRYGYALINQAASSEDAVVEGCYSYGSRGGSRIGSGGIFRDCTFELPTTASYDRVGDNGSSHAIYFHAASGNRIGVYGCRFKNIRWDGVKVSGSSLPLHSFMVQGNVFYQCGYNSDGTNASGTCILFGADNPVDATNRDHSLCSIIGNQFYNCQTLVGVIGAQNVVIANNQGHRTTDPATNSTSLISVSRYGATGEPVEQVVITGNSLTSALASGTVYATYGITAANVGVGITGRTSFVDITNNKFGGGIQADISVTGCLNTRVEGNTHSNSAAAVDLVGTRMPRIVRNDILDLRGSFAAFRMTNVSWPFIKDNWGSNTLSSLLYHSAADVGDNAGGSTGLLFPLSGCLGRAAPSEGRPEVVFSYGYGWTAGDTLTLNGTVYTYGTDFSSYATLQTLIDGLASYTANDYGDPWSITTYHMRVRYHTTSATANLFYVSTVCANKTAGVVLGNTTGANPQRCYSRGEGADKVVIWSPAAGIGQIPFLRAENADAATALQAATPYLHVVNATGESGADAVLQLSGLVGTELFQWSL